MRRSFLLVALAAILPACVGVSSTRLGPPAELPAVARSEVVVYQKEADIRGAYDKVALVYARARTGHTDESDLVEAARKRAAALGANGLVLGEFEASTVIAVGEGSLSVGTHDRARFLAVRTREAAR